MNSRQTATSTDWKVFGMVQRLSSAGKLHAVEYIQKLLDREAKAELIEREMERNHEH